MNINDILYYLYSGIPLLNFVMLIVLIIIVVKVSNTKRQLNEFARILYLSLRKEGNNEEDINDIRNQLSELLSAFGSLSSSTQTIMQDMQNNINIINNRDDRIWPTPQLAEMVVNTIREQIYTELTLSHKMRIPNQDSIKNIITITTETYPHVSIDYITRRTFAEVENMQKQNQSE